MKSPAPRILLLDEHVSSLDPRTAEKVLDITSRLVIEQNLTTIMVTHKIQDALRYGNRLLMLHRGQIILDLRDGEKDDATVEDIVSRFRTAASGDEEALPDDTIL